MRLVDTNILIYAVSKRTEDAEKSIRAAAILDEPDLALSVQVLQEFYYQSTRLHGPAGLTHRETLNFMDRFADVPVQPVTTEVFHRATELCDRYGLSYWDAAILAAAMMLGCDAVYSEDMSDQQNYDGVRVINPFVEETETGSDLTGL